MLTNETTQLAIQLKEYLGANGFPVNWKNNEFSILLTIGDMNSSDNVRVIITNSRVKVQIYSSVYARSLQDVGSYVETFLNGAPDFYYDCSPINNFSSISWSPTIEWNKYPEIIDERYRQLREGNDKKYYYANAMRFSNKAQEQATSLEQIVAYFRQNRQSVNITGMSERDLYDYIDYLSYERDNTPDEIKKNNYDYHIRQALIQLQTISQSMDNQERKMG